MPRLLIANDCPEQLIGQPADFDKALAVWSQRILWHIQEDDIIVLPVAPDPGYVEYIAHCLQVPYQSLRVLIAPHGNAGNLSADRITNPALAQAVQEVLAGRCLESVIPLTPDAAVANLASMLGGDCYSGAAFTSQGGGVLANSKAIFRAIAAGTGVPIPQGKVLKDLQQAEECLIDMLLNQAIPVIVKKDFGQGCRGNEVLSASKGLVPNGGWRGLVLSNRIAIRDYLKQNWDWLTNSNQHSFIVERYYPDSIAIFAEFNISDHGLQFAGLGEMLAKPIADGQVIPPVGLSPTTVAEIVEGGHRLSQAMYAIGYRGMLSADAIVTPENTVMFSEYNGRITGSTHIYSAIGARIVGNAWMQKRILLERRGWQAPTFQHAVEMLNDSGLAYNHSTHTGVVLTGTFIPTRKVISYTIVAEDLKAAIALEEKLHRVSPRAVEIHSDTGVTEHEHS